MVIVCCATMVKDEEDIIRQWIEYYGKIFSYENIYIIDNYSTDNTFEICKEYINKGIHLSREKFYIKKHTYMTQIKKRVKHDFFLPIDIDEFIVYYNKQDNTIECDNIMSYFLKLKNSYAKNALFKMNYIIPILTNNNDILLKQFTHGKICDYGIMAKSFLRNISHKFVIDHGNHLRYNNYILTDLHLIHYHKREDQQHKAKIKNNILGLGYRMDIDYLKQLLATKPQCPGGHHVKMAIYMLQNPSKSNSPEMCKPSDNDIKLDNFIEFMN